VVRKSNQIISAALRTDSLRAVGRPLNGGYFGTVADRIWLISRGGALRDASGLPERGIYLWTFELVKSVPNRELVEVCSQFNPDRLKASVFRWRSYWRGRPHGVLPPLIVLGGSLVITGGATITLETQLPQP
jgi:hypothetical protein